MSDAKPDPAPVPEAADTPAGAGRLAALRARLAGLFSRKPAAAAAEPDTGETSDTPPKAGLLSQLLARFSRPPADTTEMPAAPAEPAADDSAAKPSALERLQQWFDSPIKIVLAGAVALLVLLIIVLIVVLVVKRKPKAHPPAGHPPAAVASHAPASTAHGKPAAAPPASHAAAPSVAGSAADGHAAPHPAAAADAHAAPVATKDAPPHPAAHAGAVDPLAAERAALERQKAELDAQRQQLEQDKKAFAEKVGRQANGAVIGGVRPAGAASPLAGKCDLSGDRKSLRENLRQCLGLPAKIPEEAAVGEKAGSATVAPEGKPAHAPAH